MPVHNFFLTEVQKSKLKKNKNIIIKNHVVKDTKRVVF